MLVSVDGDTLKRDLEVIAALEPLKIVLSRVDCFLLLTQLQLALKHPQNEGPGAELGRRLGETLENAVALTPALRELARLGWPQPV